MNPERERKEREREKRQIWREEGVERGGGRERGDKPFALSITQWSSSLGNLSRSL